MNPEVKAALNVISLLAYDPTLSVDERLRIIKEQADRILKLYQVNN